MHPTVKLYSRQFKMKCNIRLTFFGYNYLDQHENKDNRGLPWLKMNLLSIAWKDRINEGFSEQSWYFTRTTIDSTLPFPKESFLVVSCWFPIHFTLLLFFSIGKLEDRSDLKRRPLWVADMGTSMYLLVHVTRNLGGPNHNLRLLLSECVIHSVILWWPSDLSSSVWIPPEFLTLFLFQNTSI